jgi:C-terminal processing protease CtpA/Prc
MKKHPKFYLLLFLAMGLFFTNCSNDDNIVPEVEPETENPETEEPAETAADYPVQNFMWRAMNAFYFWQADVPNLADDKFDSLEDTEYIEFLSSEEDPVDFFYRDLCFNHENAVSQAAAVDRFSFLSENYKELVQSFQGVSRSNGVDFNLYLFSNNDGVYGVVNYIAPNSDASTKDIQRGDIFTGVNGQALNLDNYQDLLFGEDATYTLNLAEIRDNTISDTGEEVSLTKVENFAENPILVNKVLEQNGIKIGYLMYNSFVADYDDELNQVFGDFEAQGVSELILDFRYNGGGRVSSAIQIASSVYGTNTDELFLKARYNDKIQSTFDPGDGENNFTDETFDSGTMLNSLNLNRVYVIATESTASASELVMNGLEPYIDVVHVGTRTVGKNEFSNTFVDDPAASYFYREDREGFINPDNQWAIQPLLGRNENADGFSDYTSGLVPDYELPEDIANLGVLGEDSDPLLDLTLSVISGATAKRSFEPEFVGEYLTSSYMFKPMGNNMSMNGLLKPVLTSD